MAGDGRGPGLILDAVVGYAARHCTIIRSMVAENPNAEQALGDWIFGFLGIFGSAAAAPAGSTLGYRRAVGNLMWSRHRSPGLRPPPGNPDNSEKPGSEIGHLRYLGFRDFGEV